MRAIRKKVLVALLVAAMTCSMTGCHSKETRKPVTNQPTPTNKQKASGKKADKLDTPLIIGTDSITGNFNPVYAKSRGDRMITDLTQLSLFQTDRTGQVVKKGIEGETRAYKGTEYTYYGPANMKVVPMNQETKYYITLSPNLKWSDGEKVTADDLIFSMYLYCDPAYDGNVAFSKLAIKGINKYRRTENTDVKNEQKNQKEVNHISGISKMSDTEVCVRVKRYREQDTKLFVMPILPLHYYGDTTAYDYNQNKFGFQKGDLKKIKANKKSPLGAGPYAFVKYEDGVVYYEANDKYMMGMPKTVYLQVKKVKKNMAAKNLSDGAINVWGAKLTPELCSKFMENNSNNKVNGKSITVRNIAGEDMHYLGMNADRVCIGANPTSKKSKALRQAVATVVSAYRQSILDRVYAGQVRALQYPVSTALDLSPTSDEEEYREAYAYDLDGKDIYSDGDDLSDKQQKANDAALQMLKKAGYKVDNKSIVSAPKNAPKKFTIWSDANDMASKMILENAADGLRTLGFKVIIKKMPADKLQKKLKSGKQQIWCTTAKISDINATNKLFGYSVRKKNYFALFDIELDKEYQKTIMETDLDIAKEYYLQCCNRIMDWNVVVPFYQDQDCVAFGASKVKTGTLMSKETAYYGWAREIDTVQMK